MEVTRVTVTEVKERMDRGETLFFLDTRNPQAWADSASKLPGAVHMDVDEVETRLGEIPHERAVITYCT